MSALAARDDALLPRDDNRLGIGAALALLAHGGLIAALAIGLHWQLPRADAVVSAELWSAVPQVAAPAAVPPPPPAPAPTPAPKPAPPPAPSPAQLRAEQQARDAEIALEKRQAEQRRQQEQDSADRARQKEADEARRLKQRLEARRLAEEEDARRALAAKKAEQAKAVQKEREKAAAEAKAKADAQAKAEAQAQAEQIAKQREANLKRMLGQAGATGAATATGSAMADAAPSQAYLGRIRKLLRDNVVQPEKERGNPTVEVEVRFAPDGSIVGRRITKTSGNPVWDETVLRAIDKTRQLPLDNGRIPPSFVFVFSQNDAN